MPWEELGTFKLITNKWIFSSEIEGEIFRVSHIPIDRLPNDSLRAVIAQGFVDEEGIPNKFNPKIFAYGEESEVFTFSFPVGLSNHSLIFKRLDKNAVEWKIKAEVFFAENPTQDYQNYILSRFGKEAVQQFHQSFNMSLTPLLFSGSTEPNSHERKLSAKKPLKVLSANDSRTKLRIYSTGQPVVLTTGFSETGQPLEVLLKLPPNYFHEETVSTAGIYKGDIYAYCEKETEITVIEFSAK